MSGYLSPVSNEQLADGKLRQKLIEAVKQRHASRLKKVLERIESYHSNPGGPPPSPQHRVLMQSAQRLLDLLKVLDELDVAVQKIEFDYHSRFSAIPFGDIKVKLTRSNGHNFGVIFGKSKLVDPESGLEFKSLVCKNMKYQGKDYNVKGCINGDVLLEVNGQRVSTSRELAAHIASLDAIEVTINRPIPRALSIDEIQDALSNLTIALGKVDALPAPPPNSVDNMTDVEVKLFVYARKVALRTEKQLTTWVLLQNRIASLEKGEITAEESQEEFQAFWNDLKQAGMDKQIYPKQGEISRLIDATRAAVNGAMLDPPPAYASDMSDTDSEDLPPPENSPRVLEATRVSVAQRIAEQKTLNNPVPKINFERRSLRGVNRRIRKHSDFSVAREQSSMKQALTAQPWVGLLEYPNDADDQRSEQWEELEFEISTWTHDSAADDYTANFVAVGVQHGLVLADGYQPETVQASPLELSGSVLLHTRHIVLQRRRTQVTSPRSSWQPSQQSQQDVFHGTLLGLGSSVPRIFAQTLDGEEIRLELTSAAALSPPEKNLDDRAQMRPSDLDSLIQPVDLSDDDVAAAEAELENSESEFFQDTARQIAELVEVEHTEHLPASRVLERNKRLSTAQHGKSMALECLASTPVSASPSRRRLSWDKALGATGEAVATVSFGSPTKSRVR